MKEPKKNPGRSLFLLTIHASVGLSAEEKLVMRYINCTFRSTTSYRCA